jgi:hypothetical protein
MGDDQRTNVQVQEVAIRPIRWRSSQTIDKTGLDGLDGQLPPAFRFSLCPSIISPPLKVWLHCVRDRGQDCASSAFFIYLMVANSGTPELLPKVTMYGYVQYNVHTNVR